MTERAKISCLCHSSFSRYFSTWKLTSYPSHSPALNLSAIRIVFVMFNVIVVKLLRSELGDTEQLTHVDFDVENANNVEDLSEFNYSAIISIQPNTNYLLVNLASQ
jgi:hypothetical protein